MVEYRNRRALRFLSQTMHDMHIRASITPPSIPPPMTGAMEGLLSEVDDSDNTSLQNSLLGANAKLSRRKG